MPVELMVGGPNPEEVMRDTWGHTDARPGVRYPGTILFGEGEYGGDRIILRADFGEEAGYGPWFYEGIHDWLFEQRTEPGSLYRFTGWYRLSCDGSHEFTGEVATVETVPSAPPESATDSSKGPS